MPVRAGIRFRVNGLRASSSVGMREMQKDFASLSTIHQFFRNVVMRPWQTAVLESNFAIPSLHIGMELMVGVEPIVRLPDRVDSGTVLDRPSVFDVVEGISHNREQESVHALLSEILFLQKTDLAIDVHVEDIVSVERRIALANFDCAGFESRPMLLDVLPPWPKQHREHQRAVDFFAVLVEQLADGFALISWRPTIPEHQRIPVPRALNLTKPVVHLVHQNHLHLVQEPLDIHVHEELADWHLVEMEVGSRPVSCLVELAEMLLLLQRCVFSEARTVQIDVVLVLWVGSGGVHALIFSQFRVNLSLLQCMRGGSLVASHQQKKPCCSNRSSGCHSCGCE
mmetsp:Transcript_30868/g.60259  ORF Transcript_30868/g.60259 Transcript_30868/m.60259 type:complete len:340 (-) Transcript_30868:51-1070(-)